MATPLKFVVEELHAGPNSDRNGASGSDFPPDLPPFRFGLRQLLLFVAAVSMLLTGLVSLRGIPALALLLASLVVAFHLLSTAIGSRLRLYANLARAGETATANPPRPARLELHEVASQAPKTRPMPWYGRNGAKFTWLPRLIALAVLAGGCSGALLLTATTGHRTSPAGLVVGAMSVAALSGWFAFIAGNFYGIVRGGWTEATASHDRDEAR